MITAACDSPFAAHRIPSLEVALLSVFVRDEQLTDGTPDSLSALLEHAVGLAPEIHALEGWWPSDPRSIVTAAFAGRRWRLHPGWTRMPTDIVETALDVAHALDPATEEHLGFRATDLVELALRYMDAAVRNAAPHWPDRPRTEPDRDRLARDPAAFTLATVAIPAVVTPAEIAAARRWSSADRLGAAASQCSSPTRALKAAEWATIDHAEVPQIGLEAHLAVRAAARRWACPASVVISRLDRLMSRLFNEVGDARSEDRLVNRAVSKLNRLLNDDLSVPFLTSDPVDLATAVAVTADAGTSAQETTPAPTPAETDSADARHGLEANWPVGPEDGPATAHEQTPTRTRPAAWQPGDPHTVLRVGSLIVSFTVVPSFTAERASEAAQRVHAEHSVVDAEDLLGRLGLAPSPGVSHVSVVVTHGPMGLQVVHGLGTAVVDLATFRHILRDADGRPGGRDLVWQYLEDLACPAKEIASILPAAADDLWAHWIEHGGFIPFHEAASRPEPITVFIGPTLWDPVWEPAAHLESVADLATRADLPDPRAMPFLDNDGFGRATAWSLEAQYSVAFAAPKIVVAGPTGGISAHVDPSTMVALVTGLRDALADSRLGDALANAEGIYRLQVLINDALGPGTQELVQLRGSDLNGFEIVIPVASLRRFVTHAQNMHDGLGQLLARPHADEADVQQALTRWRELPPLLDLDSDWRVADPPPPHEWMEPNVASRNRAERAYRARIPSTNLPGTNFLNGLAAVTWVREVALPAVLAELDRRLDDYATDRSVNAAVRAVDAAHAERARRRRVTQLGLASAHAGAVRQTSLTKPDSAVLTRPAEILLDHVLRRRNSSGTHIPSRFAMAELTCLAGLALEYAAGADLAVRGLGGLSVVTEDGGFAVLVTPTRAGVRLNDGEMGADAAESTDSARDEAADSDGSPVTGMTNVITPNADVAVSPNRWLEAVRAHHLDNPAAPAFADPDVAVDNAWRSITSSDAIPGRMRTLDSVMKRELGWGIDAMFAVLSVAASYQSDFVPRTSAAELVDQAVGWCGVPRDEVLAAVTFLTHQPDGNEDPHYFYEQERRPQRAFLRPFVSLGDSLLVPRHLARALQEVAADMLGEGRIVWPMERAVSDAANDLRTWSNRQFEIQVEQVLVDLGLPYRPNLEAHEAAAGGAPGLEGEIDVLACDVAAGRIWVLETKEHIESASPYSITERARRFLKRKKGYVDKALAKTRTVAAVPDVYAAIACGGPVTAPAHGWTVLPVMVTSRIEPAAFPQDRESAIPFVLGQDLGRYLTTLGGNYDRRS